MEGVKLTAKTCTSATDIQGTLLPNNSKLYLRSLNKGTFASSTDLKTVSLLR